MTDAKRPLYGGQAVIEGVMMRDRSHVAVALRAPNGRIIVHEDRLNGSELTAALRQIPLARGAAALIDALGVGTRALIWAAQVNQTPADAPTPAYTDPAVGLGMAAVSVSMSAALMFATPAAASGLIERLLGVKGRLAANGIESLLRLGLIVGYLTLVGQTREGKRLFSYHGAEHKTVNAYEAGAPLTPEAVARFPLSHPRCGTALLLTVAAINAVLGTLIGRPPLVWRILSRVVMLPLVAGIAYEAIQFSARHLDNPAVRVIIMPNLLFQRLTTREPDLAMLEVSICALERVLSHASDNEAVGSGPLTA